MAQKCSKGKLGFGERGRECIRFAKALRSQLDRVVRISGHLQSCETRVRTERTIQLRLVAWSHNIPLEYGRTGRLVSYRDSHSKRARTRNNVTERSHRLTSSDKCDPDTRLGDVFLKGDTTRGIFEAESRRPRPCSETSKGV